MFIKVMIFNLSIFILSSLTAAFIFLNTEMENLKKELSNLKKLQLEQGRETLNRKSF